MAEGEVQDAAGEEAEVEGVVAAAVEAAEGMFTRDNLRDVAKASKARRSTIWVGIAMIRSYVALLHTLA